MSRIAILSTTNYPFLGVFLETLLSVGIEPVCIACDRKILSDDELRIILDRLNEEFVPVHVNTLTHAVPFVHFDSINSKILVNYLKKCKVNLLVNFGSPRVVELATLRAFDGVLGVHPGLIPRYRGCTNVEWAIFEDGKIGNTVFFLTEEIDRGPIVLTRRLEFEKNDNYRDIRTKVYLAGIDLLVRGIQGVIGNDLILNTLPMPREGQYYRPIDQESMQIVLEKTQNGTYKYQL